jgi:hypothetical protein
MYAQNMCYLSENNFGLALVGFNYYLGFIWVVLWFQFLISGDVLFSYISYGASVTYYAALVLQQIIRDPVIIGHCIGRSVSDVIFNRTMGNEKDHYVTTYGMPNAWVSYVSFLWLQSLLIYWCHIARNNNNDSKLALYIFRSIIWTGLACGLVLSEYFSVHATASQIIAGIILGFNVAILQFIWITRYFTRNIQDALLKMALFQLFIGDKSNYLTLL